MRGSGCDDCGELRGSALFGYSTDLAPQFLGYAVAGPTVGILRAGERWGPSLAAGVLVRPRGFVVRIEERGDYFVSGPFYVESLLTSEGSLTWQPSTDTSLTLRASQVENLRDRAKSFGEAMMLFGRNF